MALIKQGILSMSNQFSQPIILYFTPDKICIEWVLLGTRPISPSCFFFYLFIYLFFIFLSAIGSRPRSVESFTRTSWREGETIVLLLGKVKVSKSEKRIKAFMQCLQTYVLPRKLALWQVTDTQSRTVIRNNRKIK